jgi:hypothetical protein
MVRDAALRAAPHHEVEVRLVISTVSGMRDNHCHPGDDGAGNCPDQNSAEKGIGSVQHAPHSTLPGPAILLNLNRRG